MADRATVFGAEVHAHAQQLAKFAKEHGCGFFVALVEPDGTTYEASNLSDQGRAVMADAIGDTLDAREFSTHRPGGQG